jgi:hypothetical protein
MGKTVTVVYPTADTGKFIINHAVDGFKKEWKVKTEFISKRYTTRWEEIPIVN